MMMTELHFLILAGLIILLFWGWLIRHLRALKAGSAANYRTSPEEQCYRLRARIAALPDTVAGPASHSFNEDDDRQQVERCGCIKIN